MHNVTSMCATHTPLEHYPDLGLWVKREDMCCPIGPHFSKTRGVWAHVSARPETIIGVLDTSHSQGGHAVAQACALIPGKHCVLYFPVRKRNTAPLAPQQKRAMDLGATLVALQAGRSAVLYHQARKELAARAGSQYMMPNALKLPETVAETAAEVLRTAIPPALQAVIVPASSGTIAAGVMAGLMLAGWEGTVVIHMGYSRSVPTMQKYMQGCIQYFLEHTVRQVARRGSFRVAFVDEGYEYKDAARPGDDPPWPSNSYYDLKAFRWFMREGRSQLGEALFWNVG